jgi:hypothetical protein
MLVSPWFGEKPSDGCHQFEQKILGGAIHNIVAYHFNWYF